uniref:Uncharacterized protein n=1 Tax=Avena sativa TaxID=4498 RepID=A0ACD5UYA7_AVESA
MAPPKPTSPPNPASASASASASDKKKKVTPTQVAFLVERYLADNGFAAALAAFRSDAAHLFAKTNSKLATPKGLLPLADILHDYISLKESRLAVDSAMQAMSALVSTYYSSASTALVAAQPSSPPLVPPFFVGPTASSSPPHLPMSMPPPPTGTAGYATPMIHYTQSSSSLVVQSSSNTNNVSTPAASSLPTKKRKAAPAKSAKPTSASKRICAAPTSSNPKGKSAASQLPTAQQSSAEHSAIVKLPVQGSSVAKSLFEPVQPQVSSSSCTTQQSNPIGDEPASYQTQRPSSVDATAHAQQGVASSQYSIVSSKTLIVSPMKGGTYYSVERSCHVSSPLKSCTQRSKREHVKGRLDFDSSDARPGSTENVCEKASTSTSVEKQDNFDIDFTNFGIFDNDFSISEFLQDFDLDNEGVHCENPSSNAEIQRLQPTAKSNNVMEVPVLLDSVKQMEAHPTEDTSSQGGSSVTSVRAITKRIKIVSPVKGRTAS